MEAVILKEGSDYFRSIVSPSQHTPVSSGVHLMAEDLGLP